MGKAGESLALADGQPALGAPWSPFIAFVFEGGGQPHSELEQDLRGVRHGVALDTLQTLVRLQNEGELDRVVLITDRRDLAERAGAIGVVIDEDAAQSPFHFGTALCGVIRRHGAAAALVLGGAAAPLYGVEDFRSFLRLCRQGGACAVLNNPQSPDVIAFHPAEAACSARLPETDSDNALGHALASVGCRRLLVDNSAAINFDVDTPTDCAVLDGEVGLGRQSRLALDRCAWLGPVRKRLDAVEEVLGREAGELALMGRVGPPVTSHINLHLRCRLRVFSEERGMRALGRVQAGSVVSLIGFLLDDVGPDRFFTHLSRCADAALMDTRVLLAHWKKPYSDADRFAADIGRTDWLSNPELAAFTQAAWDAAIPVVLGGHTLIYGGLWLLADRVLRRLTPVGV